MRSVFVEKKMVVKTVGVQNLEPLREPPREPQREPGRGENPKPGRRSIRLRDYDYSKPGAYFITICTKNRECVFGEISDGGMMLSEAGRNAQSCWLGISYHFPTVELDAWVIMPNHVHGIIVIPVGVQNLEPLREPQREPRRNQFQHVIPQSIGSIIRGFKIGVTKWFRQMTPGIDVWQRNFYEHVIRDEKDLNRIREYIETNPFRWPQDENHP